MSDGLDVVLIGGAARSGSTLLLRMLGSAANHIPMGELNTVWEQHFGMNRACSCGKPFRECEFWNAIADEAFGGFEAVDPKQAVALRESVLHVKKLPLLLLPDLRPPAYSRRLHEYAEMLGAIYRAVQKVSGCNVVIDSSKRPAHAWMLTEVPGIRAKMVFLVRDSRACGYSGQRKKLRIDVPDRVEYMTQGKVWRTAIYWMFHHSVTPLSSRRFDRVAICRYEDMVKAPASTLPAIAAQLDLPGQATFPFVSEQVIEIETDHTLWGNPMRAQQGTITVRPDNEWLEKMAARERRLVTLMTLPWLVKYRYPLAHRRPAPSLSTGESDIPMS